MELAKTPINVLKTFCAKKNWTVEYNMISEEGRVHEPTFTFRVFVEETGLSAIAAGFSKKKAKQAAALKALQQLAETDEEAKADLETIEENVPAELETSFATEKANPVGKLQEICMRKKWTPPVYLTDEEEGPPHAKTFTITCILENLGLESKGTDKSKKGGKKIAAQEMLNLLESKGLYDAKNDSAKSGKYHVPFKADDSERDKIVTFFRSVPESRHRQLDSPISIIDEEPITNEQLERDFVAALDKVAEMMETKSKVIEITNSINGHFHVVINLKSESLKDLPILTGFGSDKSLEKAKQKAAQTALTLLDKIRYI